MRHRRGTGAELVRNWCGTGADRVRNGCGTASERLRNGCGTAAERRRNAGGSAARRRGGVASSAGYRAKQRRAGTALQRQGPSVDRRPPCTTTAPSRGEHSQMGCVVTMAETEREKRACVMAMVMAGPMAPGWNGPRGRCGRGGLVFLALARSAARRLSDLAAWRPADSPAQ